MVSCQSYSLDSESLDSRFVGCAVMVWRAKDILNSLNGVKKKQFNFLIVFENGYRDKKERSFLFIGYCLIFVLYYVFY
jgi:hypothetical protein